MLILNDQGQVVQRTSAAIRWLRELDVLKLDPVGGAGDDNLPLAVRMVVKALRRALCPQTEQDLHSIPQLCVLGSSGRWITLQASLTEPGPDRLAETVVVIGPAGPREVLKLRTAAYGLSVREKEVLDLVVRGCSTKGIAHSLHISESTVQGHLSHVFEKVGVRSRRDLLKRLFFDNLPPDLTD